MSAPLHDRSLEKQLRSRIRQRLGDLPHSKKAAEDVRRNRRTGQFRAFLSATLQIGISSVAIILVQRAEELQPAGRLATLCLLSLWLTVIWRLTLRRHILQSPDLAAWALLPVSPEKIAERQIRKGLTGSIFSRISLLSYGLTLGLLWDFGVRGAALGIVLGFLIWVTLRSSIVVMSVWRIFTLVELAIWLTFWLSIPVAYFASARAFFFDLINSYGDPLSFIVPFGWILRSFGVAQNVLPTENLLLLLPTLALFMVAQGLLPRFRSELDILEAPLRHYDEPHSETETREEKVEQIWGTTPPTSGESRSLHPAETASIRSRQFITSSWTDQPVRPLDRVWLAMLSHRERLIVECFLSGEPGLTRTWITAAKWLLIGLGLGVVLRQRNPSSGYWAWIVCALLVLLRTFPSFFQRLLATRPCGGADMTHLVLEPVAMSELQALAWKFSWVLAISLLPVLILYGLTIGWLIPGNLLLHTTQALKCCTILPFVQQLGLLAMVSGGTTDTERIRGPWAITMLLIIGALLIGLGFLFRGFFYDDAFSWMSAACGVSFWAVIPWLYRLAYNRRWFDACRKGTAAHF